MPYEMPAEFRKACRNLGQDLANLIQNLSESDANALLVHTAIIGLDRADAEAVRGFVATVLSANLSSDEMREFWWATPAEIHFKDGSHVDHFLRALSQRLAAPPFVSGDS